MRSIQPIALAHHIALAREASPDTPTRWQACRRALIPEPPPKLHSMNSNAVTHFTPASRPSDFQRMGLGGYALATV